MYDFKSPPYYSNIAAELKALSHKYPFAKLKSAGQSLCGRELYYLKLGKGSRSATLFAGGFHAQEWLTVMLMLKYAAELCGRVASPQGGKGLARRLDERALLILPAANPDGLEIALRGAESAGEYSEQVKKIGADKFYNANARGVDINHNFNAGWLKLRQMEIENGITGPAKKQYGGISVESEPETKALVSLLREYYIETLYAFHSQGEEIFWQYGDSTPPQSEYYTNLLCGASGYKRVNNSGLYSHGGFKDYFIEKYARPGFTIEIGKGVNPLPIGDFAPIYKKLSEMLFIASVI